MIKPSIPKGTRDFSPEEMAKRNYIFSNITAVFKLFGFKQIETPAFENIETLTGKYGEEGDRLIFKILNSGNFLDKASDETIDLVAQKAENAHKKLASSIVGKALRYDLTVPFARYIVQYRNDILFPFKRYQIQPVWRADRPQKGRYQEFYQCDVDIIGSNSLLNEVELIQIYDLVFTRLGLKNVQININNRKILLGIAEAIGMPDKFIDLTIAIDKLDKIGIEKVADELTGRGFTDDAVAKIKSILAFEGTIEEKIAFLSDKLASSETGRKGIEELSTLLEYINEISFETIKLNFDITLARGLNYYTGTIFEAKALGVQIGSISGGGRYDDLTGIFGLSDVSGVGISFGADRIYDVMNELNLFPDTVKTSTKVLILNFGKEEAKFALKLALKLRKQGINVEVYPESSKMQKQMIYANKYNIPYVLFAGSSEIESNEFGLKNMISGDQIKINEDEIINHLS